MAVYNRSEYIEQRIEAAKKMQAIVMQIINPKRNQLGYNNNHENNQL